MPDSDHTRKATDRPSDADDLPSALPVDPTASWKLPAGAEPTQVGRYEVRAVLGEGAFGRVYRGFDAQLGREVAIKVPHPLSLTPAIRERFLREARAAATIHHPNVCPIYDVGTDGDLPFIVMRFIPGGTLADVLARRKAPPPPKFALTVARQLALGVAAAHAEGVVHRDLKPGNALWDEARRQVIVTDFGLARVGGEAAITGQGDVLGTPSYMSPEQARGDVAAIGPPADVYSLGVILYRMLTGEVPYTGTVYEVMLRACEGNARRPSELRPELDPTLDSLCLKAMAVDPAARFPSAKAFADALGAYLRATEGAEDLPLAEPIADAPRRNPPDVFDAVVAPPAAQTRGPAAEPTPRSAPRPAPPRRPPPPPAEVSAQVVCPRCQARMRISATRTTPVPCPMCDCLFSVGAGRQAAARVAARRGTGRSSEHRAAPVTEVADDARDAGPRPEWRPVAAGLTLAWSGTIVAGIFVVLAAGYAVGTAGQRPTRDPAEFWAGQVLLGLGAAVGMAVVATGRWWAAAVPARVAGGLAGRLGAAAALVGTSALTAGYALLTRAMWFGTPDGPPDPTTPFGTLAVGFGLTWLVVGEWLYHRQLDGIARRVPDYPHLLASSVRVLFLLEVVPAGVCAVLAGASEVMTLSSATDRWRVPAVVLSGLAAAVLCPVWLLLTHWLTGMSASAVARHARGEDD